MVVDSVRGFTAFGLGLPLPRYHGTSRPRWVSEFISLLADDAHPDPECVEGGHLLGEPQLQAVSSDRPGRADQSQSRVGGGESARSWWSVDRVESLGKQELGRWPEAYL